MLVQVYGLPADRIYATYFGGDGKSGLPADFEARDIWLKFLPNEQVLPFGSKVSPLFKLFGWKNFCFSGLKMKLKGQKYGLSTFEIG